MKLRIRFLALLLLLTGGSIAHADPADDARYVTRVLKKVDDGIEKARKDRDRPEWYVQCQGDLKELEDALPRLPEADRKPYAEKIKVYRPEIEAGVALSRGLNVARRIRGTIDSAKEDLPKGPIDDTIFESIDRYFADPDAKAIPAEQMKVLQKDYADLKKESAKKKK